jgi:hypothetical protein
MRCIYCDGSLNALHVSKFSENKNYICLNCKAHKYNDKWYTKKEWFKYVNEDLVI